MNAAITSTGRHEFHSGAGEQSLSLDFLHRYLLGNHRDLYAATLALDINDHNAGLIIKNLLTRLAAGDGNLAQTATALGVTEPELGRRIDAAGFGHLLRQDVLDHYRSRARA